MKRGKVVDNECWKGTKENLNLHGQVYCEDFKQCKVALWSGVISLHVDDLLKQQIYMCVSTLLTYCSTLSRQETASAEL